MYIVLILLEELAQLNQFLKRTALRIAAVSIVLASITSPLAWLVARESAEETVVSLANEESARILQTYHAGERVDQQKNARKAAELITGGLFDIAEIYDSQGQRLAESMTSRGKAVESLLDGHGAPDYLQASYESIERLDEWVLRVFVPLRDSTASAQGEITGYFEGVRIIPTWQQEQIFNSSLTVASLVGLASLLCGALIFPLVAYISRDNDHKALEVLDSHISMMEALGRAIARRDSDTGAHNYRVAWLAAQIAEGVGLSAHDMQALIAGSFLHDVGKIGIPDAILLKPGKLDDDEMAIMRTHVDQGAQIVKGMGWLDGAHEVVVGHHEKWNGSGYPRGISGESIPLAARIFAVADVFDALCSKRPYKEPMSFQDAMVILQRDSGSHFDPAVIAVFVPIAEKLYLRLAGSDEADSQRLLENCIRKHFEL